jgi:hypothetical protein
VSKIQVPENFSEKPVKGPEGIVGMSGIKEQLSVHHADLELSADP